MNILLVEPFYSGSHKHFADQLKKYSQHKIDLLTLDGKFWKWRMYGAAITLGEKYNEIHDSSTSKPDMILVTDMLDLPTFLSIIIHKDIPVINYFHENQFAYPWSENSVDKAKKNRDLHYGMMNYHSAYVSDKVLFNSKYNMDSFLLGLRNILKKMPDHSHMPNIDKLKKKCQVMPLGLELKKLTTQDDANSESHQEIKRKINSIDGPLILWNHRWEHDKNPESFFGALRKLKAQNIPFKLAILGETYAKIPEIFFKKVQKDFF